MLCRLDIRRDLFTRETVKVQAGARTRPGVVSACSFVGRDAAPRTDGGVRVAMRTPVFQLHILPLFRATDREHMLLEKESMDLWDYDQVVQRADQILDRLKDQGPLMPPLDSGGPWPDEWVQLFQRWKDTGFKRLELGTGHYIFDQGASRIVATGTFPAAGYVGWLQIESETDASRTYVLYFEPPAAAVAGDAEPFRLVEPYDGPGTQSIFVHDSTGVHQIR
jgi:hypothetical protein